ncbi:MAG TPA: glycoside hydrolase family 38 C-terminal domain-containing protein, partial [Deinococcales bacterium]|nr:glycoside hydrolase family 38 C-terminal domain-containing protein [Deinococcales bacterium]
RNLKWRPAGAREWLGLFGMGNHGGGPTRAAIQNIRDLNEDSGYPSLSLGSLEGFFDRAAERPLPDYTGELQHHARGCYSAFSEIKRLNRRAEYALLAAERWQALAHTLAGAPLNGAAEREAAWRSVLFNQFHDILAGSSVETAYRDARHELGEALAVAGRLDYLARQQIAQRVDTRRNGEDAPEALRWPRWTFSRWVADMGAGVPVVVFNPSPWERREVLDVEVNDWHAETLSVLDDVGRPVPHQPGPPRTATAGRGHATFPVTLPPLGYAVYRIVDGEPEGEPVAPEDAVTAGPEGLENRFLRLRLDPSTGAVRSLIDKERGLELLAGPAAQLLVMNDPTDTWGHGLTSLRHLAGVFGGAAVKVLEAGPLRATLAVDTRHGDSTARVELTLTAGSRRLDGRVTINWNGRHQAVKLAFPLALSEVRATFDTPFGAVDRPANGGEEPGGAWTSVSGLAADALGRPVPAGASLLNDGKPGVDVLGGEVRLTVLRSPVFAHHDPQELDPDGDYAYQDQGRQSFRFSLLPHPDGWSTADTVRAAHDLNQPVTFIREYAHDGPLPPRQAGAAVEAAPGVVVTAIKPAEDGQGLVLRAVEMNGEPGRVSLKAGIYSGPLELSAHAVKTLRLLPGGTSRPSNFVED